MIPYVERVCAEIKDASFRERLREELTEHWEDYMETHGSDHAPEKVFGDEQLIGKQTDVISSPGIDVKDLLIALASTLATLLFSGWFSMFFFQLGVWEHVWIGYLFLVPTLSLLGGASYGVYLAIHRRIQMRYGTGSFRLMLLSVLFWLPWGFTIIVGLSPLFQSGQTPDSIYTTIVSTLLPGGALLAVYLTAAWHVRMNFSSAERLLGWMTWLLPYTIIFLELAGIFLMQQNSIASMQMDIPNQEAMEFLLYPFTIPILVLYLCWAGLSQLFAWIAGFVALPAATGFWITVVACLLVSTVVPLVYLWKRRRIPHALRFIMAIFLPLIIIVPLFKQRTPHIEWHVPLVWSWEELEAQQLNVAYPWAATLMRQNDAMSLEYGATAYPDELIVQQEGSVSISFKQDEKPSLRRSVQWALNNVGKEMSLDVLPSGFACDGISLEDIATTAVINGYGSEESQFGVEGTPCTRLTYKGHLIAELDRRLEDVDLTETGLLAVTVSMGFYDPNYVYILDLSGL